MIGLNADDIAKLLGESRTRNQYGPKLMEFVESDEAAINPVDIWPVEFGSKESTTLYQGFLNAAKKAGLTGDNGNSVLRIVQRDGNVFILHNARVAEVVKATTEVTTDEVTTEPDES